MIYQTPDGKMFSTIEEAERYMQKVKEVHKTLVDNVDYDDTLQMVASYLVNKKAEKEPVEEDTDCKDPDVEENSCVESRFCLVRAMDEIANVVWLCWPTERPQWNFSRDVVAAVKNKINTLESQVQRRRDILKTIAKDLGIAGWEEAHGPDVLYSTARKLRNQSELYNSIEHIVDEARQGSEKKES